MNWTIFSETFFLSESLCRCERQIKDCQTKVLREKHVLLRGKGKKNMQKIIWKQENHTLKWPRDGRIRARRARCCCTSSEWLIEFQLQSLSILQSQLTMRISWKNKSIKWRIGRKMLIIIKNTFSAAVSRSFRDRRSFCTSEIFICIRVFSSFQRVLQIKYR